MQQFIVIDDDALRQEINMSIIMLVRERGDKTGRLSSLTCINHGIESFKEKVITWIAVAVWVGSLARDQVTQSDCGHGDDAEVDAIHVGPIQLLLAEQPRRDEDHPAQDQGRNYQRIDQLQMEHTMFVSTQVIGMRRDTLCQSHITLSQLEKGEVGSKCFALTDNLQWCYYFYRHDIKRKNIT